ncbi:2-oxo acid dehydrogenase subunit E2 [Alphaproteobacteria bacterium]|nr:2-oxo acid dehydrogenase subunit E2 [Alphaproteobacteria bacterium]
MSIKILMPALSPTMTEGNLSKWLVKEGDKVNSGDVIAEIETDKATMEIESADEGIVTKLLIKEGTESVPVNSPIAVLDGEDNDKDDVNYKDDYIKVDAKINNKEKHPKEKLSSQPTEENKKTVKEDMLFNNQIKASPIVKKIAKEDGINLDNVKGSGPNGRIIMKDLNITDKIDQKIDDDFYFPSSIRKVIAKRTTETKQNVPHFYLSIESNTDKLIEMRKKINQNLNEKISINDILVKALAQAQVLNPATNVSWSDGKIIKYETIDVSIAVALKEGLITPIIKDADKKGLIEISLEIKELVNKANKGSLLPEEYNGGTISISNLGMFGITEFSAIINPPQSSILAVGAIRKVPSVENDAVVITNKLKSTLSADHRVLDGSVAAKLLKDFNDIIEDPFNLWLMSNDMKLI